MQKQLMIVGFHRSGTSMLTQELHNAGLFVGEKLMGPHFSNADGHYEDFDFFNFHEKILLYNSATWQYTANQNPKIPQQCEFIMEKIIKQRDTKHLQWGFKDPRTALFLDAWQKKLSNPYTIAIYRHYEECVNSLLHRASIQIAYGKDNDTTFWDDPTLGYKMWLSYNNKIIEHIKKHPQTTILVSHEAVIEGFPIVQTIKDKFDFDLDIKVQSTIKKDLISSVDFAPYTIDKTLKNELEKTWNTLQELSILAYKKTKTITDNKSNTTYNTNQLVHLLNRLGVSTQNKTPLQKIIEKLNDNTIEIKDKISIIQKNRALFRQFRANSVLIDAMISLADIYKNADLFFMLSDIYQEEQNYKEAKVWIDKAFETANKIFPYFYNHLARYYLKINDYKLAEETIKQAIGGNPNNHMFYLTYSILEEKKCNYNSALQQIDKAIEKTPNNKINHNLHKINLLTRFVEYDKAYNLTIKLAKEYPDEKMILMKKDFFVKSSVSFDKEKEIENILNSLRKDDNYYSKINVILDTIKNDWAYNNLSSYIYKHLNKLTNISTKVSFDRCAVSFVVDALPMHY